MLASFAQTAKRFFSPEALFPFVIGSIALGVLSNAVFTALTNLLGTGTSAVLSIAVGSLLILGLAVWVVSRLVRVPDVINALPGKRSPSRRRGLILLVSNKPPCEKAIEFHRPVLERVWLVSSIQSLSTAKELQCQYPDLITGEPLIVNDVNDPLAFHVTIESVYHGLPDGWAAQDVIADYVGMTSHGSVGVVLACWNRDRPMQYTPAIYDENRKPIHPLDPIEICLKPMTSLRG